MKNQQYNIGAVAKRTGLKPFLIRTWEKRYNAINPDRTDTNRRLYSEGDVKKLQLLALATDMGHNIGRISHLTVDDLEELIYKDKHSNITAASLPDQLAKDDLQQKYISSMMSAVRQLESGNVEYELMKASSEYTQFELLEKIIIPFVEQIGILWQKGQLRIVQEHLATAVVRKFLLNLMDEQRYEENSPRILATTPLGQYHTLGSLIAANIASFDGWHPTYLGPSLPAEEMAAALEITGASAIVITIVYPTDDPHLHKELLRLGALLPDKAALFVTGRGAEFYKNELRKIEAVTLLDMKQFRDELQSLRQ